MTYVEEEFSPDEWTVVIRPDEAAESLQTRLKNKYDKTVKPDVAPLDFVVGLKVAAPNWARVASEAIDRKAKVVAFNLSLTRTQLRLEVGEPTNTQFKLGSMSLPTDLEEYRMFLLNLSNWTGSGASIVSEGTFKDWSKKNAKKPTQYKNYSEMQQKSKSDTEAFKAWAKNNASGKKALAELDKTEKLKASDPARAKAMKAIDAALLDYYKSL